MITTKKFALGLAGAAIVAGSTFGLTATSFAAGPTPTPTAQPGTGFGRMGGPAGCLAGQTPGGTMNGAGYGATTLAAYLAEKLGVPQADVQKALDAYRATHTATTRGRDRDAAQLAADHDALATSLAAQLKVDKATVLEAINAMPATRQARGAGVPGGLGRR